MFQRMPKDMFIITSDTLRSPCLEMNRAIFNYEIVGIKLGNINCMDFKIESIKMKQLQKS